MTRILAFIQSNLLLNFVKNKFNLMISENLDRK